ncbi:MAG: CoA transferase [SAR324 cluster bacterium]|nr:CoA transferase [SAR324 cluster bacterium]
MGQGLDNLTVLEMGGGVAAAYAAKLMADLGAQVVKLEPPGGDPSRRRGPFAHGRADVETSGAHLFLNANKRSLELDGESAHAALELLAGRAQVLIQEVHPTEMAAQGLDYERLSAVNTGLVMLSITPFGLSGPHRDYAAADLNLVHSGGWGWNCPGPGTDPALPPIKAFGEHALIQAGLHGAMAALGAHYAALRCGVGEHIDLAVQEVVVNLLGRHFVNYTYARWIDSRLTKPRLAPNGFFQCKDGMIYLVIVEEDQWRRLLELMGEQQWGGQEKFQGQDARCANVADLHARLEPWLAKWNARELYHELQGRRIAACLVAQFGDLLEDTHLQQRGFFREQEHPAAGRLVVPGAPYKLHKPWWELRSPAPRLGEANGELSSLLVEPGDAPATLAPAQASALAPAEASALPLAGVRVLDFTWYWAGPHGTLMLAHLGAEVIKVESPNRLDIMRRFSNTAHDMEPGMNRVGSFNQLGQSKLSFAVNLSHPEGKQLVKELAGRSDVVTSNFSTGVMERLGFGAEALHAINPELIVAELSGFGQDGPCKDYIGYGQAIVPLAGISAQTGYPGGPPAEVAIAYGDPNGGIYMAYAVVAALVARARHGGGQVIDVSLWESTICSAYEGWMNHALGLPPHPPMGNHDLQWAPHNCYRCAGEDQWISIAVTREEQWRSLCLEMGQPALAEDARFRDARARKAHEDELDALLAAWCAGQERWALTRRLQAVGVAAFPSLSTKEVDEDAHLHARNFLGRVPHPEVGVRSHAGIPWQLARRPNGVRTHAPLMDQHTDQVCREVLGLDDGEIARLRKAGVLG